jgi:hypothetical protein
MKKVFSISLSVLILATMLPVFVAVHYCGGTETGLKISYTAELASCGMEGPEKEQSPLTGTRIESHCCDDVVSSCGIFNYYTPSFSYFPEYHKTDFQLIVVLKTFFKSHDNNIALFSAVGPSGVLLTTDVDLSDIRVLRI